MELIYKKLKHKSCFKLSEQANIRAQGDVDKGNIYAQQGAQGKRELEISKRRLVLIEALSEHKAM